MVEKAFSLADLVVSIAVTECDQNTDEKLNVYRILLRSKSGSSSEWSYFIQVYKRFDEILDLYKSLHRYSSNLSSIINLPKLDRGSRYFKRFSHGYGVEERRQKIQEFFDFCSSTVYLFLHNKFIKFFQQGIFLKPEEISIFIQDHAPTRPLQSCIKKSTEKHKNGSSSTSCHSTPARLVLSDDESDSSCNDFDEHDFEDNILSEFESLRDAPFYESTLKCILKAEAFEQNESFEEAFDQYKKAVGILLKGVQEEKCEIRRLDVRRLTSACLSHADHLHRKNSSKSSESTAFQWCTKYFFIRDLDQEIMVSSHRTLANYRVKGLFKSSRCPRAVIVVYDHRNENILFTLKTLRPMSNNKIRPVFPHQVPFMTSLHRVIESQFDMDPTFLLVRYHPDLPCLLTDWLLETHLRQEIEDLVKHQQRANDCKHLQWLRKHSSAVERIYQNALLNQTTPKGRKISCQNSCESRAHARRNRARSLDSICEKTNKRFSAIAEQKIADEEQERDQQVQSYASAGSLVPISVNAWAAELVTAVCALHAQGVLLRQLGEEHLRKGPGDHISLDYFYCWSEETSNSLIAWPRQWAITQLGLARKNSLASSVSFHQQPFAWEFEQAQDWFRVGLLLYHLMTGLSFWDVHSFLNASHDVTMLRSLGKRVLFPGLVQADARDLICMLLGVCEQSHWVTDPLVMQHRFFARLDWKALFQVGLQIWSDIDHDK